MVDNANSFKSQFNTNNEMIDKKFDNFYKDLKALDVKFSSRMDSFSASFPPSGGESPQPSGSRGQPHEGCPPPEWLADVLLREDILISTITVWGTFCSQCHNFIPLKFKNYCPFIFCPSNSYNDDMEEDQAAGGNEPSHAESVDEASASLGHLKNFIMEKFPAARPP